MAVDLTTLNIEVNSSKVKEAEKALDDLTTSAARTDKKVDGLGNTATKTGSDVGGLGTKARKTSGEIDGLGKDAERTKQKVAGMGDALGKVKGFLAGLGILGVSKSIIQMASDFEQLQIRLNQTMGGAAQGKAAFDWIKQFAKDTPYEVKNVTDAFMRMRAYGIDPMNGSMKSVADAAAKLGGGYETLDGLSRGLGQAWAKQKLQGEEIMQLVERGVPVWDMLAKVTGKTTQELMKMSEKGLLGRDVIQKLMDEMGRDAAGSAAAQMDSFAGKLSNLMDRAGQWVDELRTSSDFLKTMGFAVEFVTNHFDGFMIAIMALLALGLPALFGVIGTAIASIATSSAIVVGGLGGLTAAEIGFAATTSGVVVPSLAVATEALLAFTIGLMTNPIFLAIAAIAVLGYALYSMRDITIETADGQKRLGDVASDAWDSVATAAGDAMTQVSDYYSTYNSILLDFWSAVGEKSKEFVQEVVNGSKTMYDEQSKSWAQTTADIEAYLSSAKDNMVAKWDEFTAWLLAQFPDIPAAFDDAMSFLANISTAIGNQMVSILGVDTVNSLKNAFEGLASFVKWVLGGIMTAIDKVEGAIAYVQGKHAQVETIRVAGAYGRQEGFQGSAAGVSGLSGQASPAFIAQQKKLDDLNKSMAKNTAAVNHGSDSAKKSVNEFQKMVSSLRIKNRESTAGGKALDGTYAVAKNIQDVLGDKLKYFSAFNDKYHAGTGSKHVSGLAFDLSLEDGGRNSVAAVEKINALLQRLGLAAGKDYKVLDEYKNPSEKATAGHIHVQLASAQVANGVASNNEQTSKWAGKESEADKYLASLNEQNQSLTEQVAIIGKKTELEKMDALILAGKYGAVDDAEHTRMVDILAKNKALKAKIALNGFKIDNAEKLAAMQQETELIGLSADAVERLKFVREMEAQAALARVGASPEVLAAIDAEMNATIAARDAGIVAQNAVREKANSWGGALKNSWSGFVQEAGNSADKMKGVFDNAFNGISTALGDLITTGKADFKSLASSILSEMAKVLMSQAFSKIFGSMGGAGGLFSGLSFSFLANGGAFSGGVQMFANGGAFSNSIASRPTAFGMSGGKMGVMGEAGPEAIMPLTRMSGGKLGVQAIGGGGGGNSVVVNVVTNVQSNGDSKTETSGAGDSMKKFGEMMAAKAREVVMSELRQGGMLAAR